MVIKEKNNEVHTEIERAEDNLKHAESLSKEPRERMAKGIKEKDFSGIQVAHERQNIASKKSEDARKGLEDLDKKKRKLMDQLEKYAKRKKI